MAYIKRGIRYVLKGIPAKTVEVQTVSLAPSELLAGKTALITGGTSGIGKAIAIAFLKAGADVIITGRNLQKAKDVAEEITALCNKGKAFGVALNNKDIASFTTVFNEILGLIENKPIDILVNNAGTGEGGSYRCSVEDYENIMDTNLKGAYFLSRIVSDYMRNNKIQGNILNIASSSSLRPATTPYILSKWGIKGMTIGLAKILIKDGIVVNGLAPGPTATPMLNKDINDDLYIPDNPSERFATPDEIANMAVILTSGMGRMIVGDTIYMTGGAGVLTVDDIKY